MPQYGGGSKCGFCGKTVYMAEEVIGPKSAKFHKLCFKCTACNKQLDSTTARDHEGKLYCSGCYGKNFGPTGYGFGVGAGALTNTGK